MPDRIKVLVVDDSTFVRKVVIDLLSKDPEIEVIGTANNGKTAVFRNKFLKPDVITMDIEMPLMNGLDALREIIQEDPKPVIMMSVFTQDGADMTFKALEYGAVDFVPKPLYERSIKLEDIGNLLISKIKYAYKYRVRVPEKPSVDSFGRLSKPVFELNLKKEASDRSKSSKIIAIGTSTGGPSALMNIFKALPDNFPSPVLVVQHLPEGFTKAFADRLDSVSGLHVKVGEEGEKILPGYGYIAPGECHMQVANSGGDMVIRLLKGEKVSGHMPSIDMLFLSLAESCGKDSIAVIMTGMGKDGSEGILKVRKSGGYTIAQNEDTSVIYGMNRVAVEIGAIEEIVPLGDIPVKIIQHL
jgi:two-component system chemotaxis response regulator CheB